MINELKDFLLLVKAEIKRDYIYMLRYPMEILSFFIIMYMILMAIIFGVNMMIPNKTGWVLNQIILGYALMNFIMSSQMGWSGAIQNESETGTLEQLSISGHYLSGVLFARGISQFPRHTFNFFTLYALLNYSTGTVSNFSFLYSIPILFTGMIGIFGVSFVFAGITLLLKRVGMFFQIVNFGFLALFWISPDKLSPFLKTLYYSFPLTLTMHNLGEVMIRQNPMGVILGENGYWRLLFFSLAFFFTGMYIFRWFEKTARERALLSQY